MDSYSRIIGIAARNIESGQICILGKDIITSGIAKVKVADYGSKYFFTPTFSNEFVEKEESELQIIVTPKERN